MRSSWKMGVGVVLAVALGWSGTAKSDPVDIGGRVSVVGNLAVVSQRPDEFGDTDTLIIGTTLNYTTPDARFELGAGLQIIGLFGDDFDEIGLYTPSFQVRINSDLMGPEENVLVYLGFIAGATIIDSDILEDEIGVFGPKFGGEFYITPSVALQIEDQVLADTEDGVTNNFLVGFKYLF